MAFLLYFLVMSVACCAQSWLLILFLAVLQAVGMLWGQIMHQEKDDVKNQ